MEPKLIAISVAGAEVLASVAAGMDKCAGMTANDDACCTSDLSDLEGSQEISEKNSKKHPNGFDFTVITT